MNPKIIKDQSELDRIAEELADRDDVLGGIFERLGSPPLWARRPGLPTLIKIVLEQQVSLASGRAAYAKLANCCGGSVSAKRIIALGESGLREKAIAEAVRSRHLAIRTLGTMSDERVREKLMSIKGIGVWTSDVYLLMALSRSDILPLGDVALENEIAQLWQLNNRPDNEWILRQAENWRPFRAAAARMIWHSYLHRLGRYSEI